MKRFADGLAGTSYEGGCVNCARTIRAAFFLDWQSVEPPPEINVLCHCGYGNRTVTLYRVPRAEKGA